ncbi:hypothetical protein Tco_0743742 [Tanacetum coccineum]
MSTRSSTRNLFPPLEDPERTIRRRTRVDPNLLNNFEEINMAANENGDDGPPPAGASYDFMDLLIGVEAEFLGGGAKLMGLQFLQLELRLGKNPSRSFRPVKSAKILWQFWASSSFGVSLAHDGSWSKWEPSLWLCG